MTIALTSPKGGELLGQSACARILREAAETVESTVRFVLSTTDHAHDELLWPSDTAIFKTNPMSVAHGACGPTLFLNHPSVPAAVSGRTLDWLFKQPLSTDTYPPGLYLGLAGVACTLMELGAEERGVDAMRMAFLSPLLFDEPGLLLGVAGWGLAALHFHRRTRDSEWLDWATRAGDFLLESAKEDRGTYYWVRHEDGRTHFGFGHGASGVALFLIRLYEVTKVEAYKEAAARAVAFDLANETPSEPFPSWQRFVDDTLVEPYLVHGNAGIGSVVIRCYAVTNDPQYLTAARRIASNCSTKFAATPGLFEGLAGIGEFLLDMYYFTGDPQYRAQALDIADSVMWFSIRDSDGVAWPGRWLDAISNDYAAGAAGIGLFLARLPRPGGRPFLDYG